jgi:hypothetical protein
MYVRKKIPSIQHAPHSPEKEIPSRQNPSSKTIPWLRAPQARRVEKSSAKVEAKRRPGKATHYSGGLKVRDLRKTSGGLIHSYPQNQTTPDSAPLMRRGR